MSLNPPAADFKILSFIPVYENKTTDSTVLTVCPIESALLCIGNMHVLKYI
jgi:hypothetical protein